MSNQSMKMNQEIYVELIEAVENDDLERLKEVVKGRDSLKKVKNIDHILRRCTANSDRFNNMLEMARLIIPFASPFTEDIHKEKNNRDCALLIAIEKQNIKLVELFIDTLKSEESINSNQEVLQSAVLACVMGYEENGQLGEILELIISKTNIDLNFEGNDKMPPLQIAAKRKKPRLIEIILTGNCDINYKNSKDGNTALHFAALKNNEQIVRILLNNGANVIVKNCRKMVPNGFTTSTKIIDILNKQANRLENETLRQRAVLNQNITKKNNGKIPNILDRASSHFMGDSSLSSLHFTTVVTPATLPMKEPQSTTSMKGVDFAPIKHDDNNEEIISIPQHERAPEVFRSFAVAADRSNGYSLRGGADAQSTSTLRSKNKNKLKQEKLVSQSQVGGKTNKILEEDSMRKDTSQIQDPRSVNNVSYISPDGTHYPGYTAFQGDTIQPYYNNQANVDYNMRDVAYDSQSMSQSQLSRKKKSASRIGEPPTPDQSSYNARMQQYGAYGYPVQQAQQDYPPLQNEDWEQLQQINKLIQSSGQTGQQTYQKQPIPVVHSLEKNVVSESTRRSSSDVHSKLTGNSEIAIGKELKDQLQKLRIEYNNLLQEEDVLHYKQEILRHEIDEKKTTMERRIERSNVISNEENCFDCGQLFVLPNSELNFSQEIEYWLHREAKIFEKQVCDMNNVQLPILEELISLMDDIVKRILPKTKLLLFGSFATGLCLPWSDIDIVLDIDCEDGSHSAFDILSAIENALNQRTEVFEDVKFISSTAFPVIKIVCTEKYLKKKLDITLQDDRHNGIKCVELVKEYLLEYEDILRPLIYILKHLLFHAGLNDPYQGGLSSYGLILMMVSLLQWYIYFVNESIESIKNNLGRTLLQFLSTYGSDFNPYKYEIHPNPPNCSQNLNPFQETTRVYNFYEMMSGGYITVVDPVNRENNVTKSTHKFNVIKMIFNYAYLSVNQPCFCDLSALKIKARNTGSAPSLQEHLSEKFNKSSDEERWRVLNKIFNSYKSPFFYTLTTASTRNY